MDNWDWGDDTAATLVEVVWTLTVLLAIAAAILIAGFLRLFI